LAHLARRLGVSDNSKNREGRRGTAKRSGAAREREENRVAVIGDWRMGWRLDRGELKSYAHRVVTLDVRK
jgi:hypothetical protein